MLCCPIPSGDMSRPLMGVVQLINKRAGGGGPGAASGSDPDAFGVVSPGKQQPRKASGRGGGGGSGGSSSGGSSGGGGGVGAHGASPGPVAGVAAFLGEDEELLSDLCVHLGLALTRFLAMCGDTATRQLFASDHDVTDAAPDAGGNLDAAMAGSATGTTARSAAARSAAASSGKRSTAPALWKRAAAPSSGAAAPPGRPASTRRSPRGQAVATASAPRANARGSPRGKHQKPVPSAGDENDDDEEEEEEEEEDNGGDDGNGEEEADKQEDDEDEDDDEVEDDKEVEAMRAAVDVPLRPRSVSPLGSRRPGSASPRPGFEAHPRRMRHDRR